MAARSGAKLLVYRHNDLLHLEELLQASNCRRKLVVTDSLFSMDGMGLSLLQVSAAALCQPANFYVLVKAVVKDGKNAT